MFFPIERMKTILKELQSNIFTDVLTIESFRRKSCQYGDFDLLNEDGSQWETFSAKDRWGSRDSHCWFKTTLQIPESFEGKPAVLRVRTERTGWDATNPQFLSFIDGKIDQGLDVNHTEIFLTDCAKAHQTYSIDLYAYSGMMEGDCRLLCDLSIWQQDVENLYYNIKVPLEVAELLDEEDPRRIDTLTYLTEAVNLLDLRKAEGTAFHQSVAAATAYLDKQFYGNFCGQDDITEICVGHTHIDVAWLWTLAQTREKATRSFSTVLSLMKRYPEYIFMSSQPQLYQFVKQDHPEIYEQIKQMVKAGRWEAEGAMWLEADCNLTCGESLVRQILFGSRFFRKEFGVENKILWLPDVFGYSAALPQILKKSGIDYFMTTKISWNEFNKIPYDTFLWQGIDGTEVLTHFVSTQDYSKEHSGNFTTYNGNINPKQVIGCWQRYQQKDISHEVLNCFGYGDGGGGPTREMLENAKRLEKGIPGAPKVKMGTARRFFEDMEKRVSENKYLPKWVGELYLEFHRGTYTTMARNKKYNRSAEFLNMDAEWSSVLGSTLLQESYPAQEINQCWETTLLNQFHDIIPGSSIQEVYEDSKAQYEQLLAADHTLINGALKKIAGAVQADTTSVVVFNQLGFSRSDIVSFALPDGWTFAKVFDGGTELDAQKANGEILFFAENVPAKGYKAFRLEKAEEEPTAKGFTVSNNLLENSTFAICLDENGSIVSIVDKVNNRQVLQAGQRANVLQAFEDKPNEYDAWNIDIFYQEKMWEIDDVTDIKVTENGKVRCGVTIQKKFLDSTIEQTIYLYNKIDRIDFDSTIDWKEHQILLKAAFPVDVHATKATYEIQFGNVERPTHWNTSWDWAKYEVCAHKWADLSEGDYGVSLLNNCKYGHDVKDSTMRLTLLKSSIYPNPAADKEVHHFVYSLYPHANDWKQAKTAQMAYSLNCPLYAYVQKPHTGVLPQQFSFVSVNQDNICVETVKKAEDSDAIIVRMYEYQNKRTPVTCTLCRPAASVAECNLMEQQDTPVETAGNSFSFTMQPYEIKTFKILLS